MNIITQRILLQNNKLLVIRSIKKQVTASKYVIIDAKSLATCTIYIINQYYD